MKIGINYLTETVKMVEEDEINIDYIKYPSVASPTLEELKMIRQKTKKDVLLHGLITKDMSVPNILSPDFISKVDEKREREFFVEANAPGMSLHLGDDSPNENNTYTKDELLKILYKNVDYIKNTFGDIIGFLELENREKSSSMLTLTPDFITEAIKVAECDFLLDISHAKNASKLLEMDYMEYIKSLPLDKVRELHLNGWKYIGEEFVSHIKINDEGYECIRFLSQNSNAQILTIEYGVTKDDLDYLLKKCPDFTYEFNQVITAAIIGKINKKVESEILEQIIKLKGIYKVK